MIFPKLLFILFFALGSFAYTQQPIAKNYTTLNGLPSSETYDIYQDSLGYIWITTDRGLSRFDGDKFINFDQAPPLSSLVVFNFFEENKTKVWFSTKEGKLYHFNPIQYPIKFHPFHLNEQLSAEINSLHFYSNIKQFKHIDNHYYIGFDNSTGYLKISESGASKFIDPYKDFNTIPISDIVISPKIHYTEMRSEQSEQLTIHDVINDTKIHLKNPNSILKMSAIDASKIIKYKTGFIILSGYHIIKYESDTPICKKLSRIGLDLILENDKILVATFDGIHEFDSALNETNYFLKNKAVSSLYIDQENALWATTTSNGIFYLKNRHIKSITHQESPLNSRYVFTNNGHVFFHNDNKNIYVFDNSGHFLYHSPHPATYTRVAKSFCSIDTSLQAYLSPKKMPLQDSFYYYNLNNKPLKVNFAGDNTFSTTGKLSFHYFGLPSKAHDILYIGDTVLLATDAGLYALTSPDHIFTHRPFTSNLFSKPLKHLKQIQAHFVTSTENEGLFIFKDSIDVNINESDGLLDNYISAIEIENDTTIWVSSYKGLNKLTFKDHTFKKYDIQKITSSEGLSNNEITDITISNQTLWLCTKNGAHCFNTQTQFQTPKSFFHIDSVLVNGLYQQSRLDTITHLNYADNLNIFYSIVNFDNTYFSEVQYSFSNDSTISWLPMNKKHLFLNHLATGNYTLKIKLDHQPNILFEQTIIVSPPYWQTWYFITLVVSFIISILLLTIKLSIKINNKRKQKELDKIKLEIKAITAQMNPHFTFNTINSIQHYLIQNDKIGGIQYLSAYAKLMRQSLKHSRSEFISIEEELSFLKLYTELEKKRFEKPFEIKFDVVINSNPRRILIPALLLQPLIENAIIHGINATDKEGLIIVRIHQVNRNLEIEVSDNGIGILNTPAIDDKKSFGLNILKERLRIYNHNKTRNHTVKYSYLDEANKTGTKIKFNLSIKVHESNNN